MVLSDFGYDVSTAFLLPRSFVLWSRREVISWYSLSLSIRARYFISR